MTATHHDQITHDMIRRRLLQVVDCHVVYTDRLDDVDDWNVLAQDHLIGIRPRHVEAVLECSTLMADSAAQEIDMAINIAAEPPGLPGCACVVVRYATPTRRTGETGPSGPPVVAHPILAGSTRTGFNGHSRRS